VRPFWKIYNILSCHRGVKIWESWVSAKVVEEDAVRGQGASEGQRGDAVCLRLCGRMLRERARALSGSRHLRPLAGGSAMPAAPYRLGAGRRRRDTGWRAGRRRQCARRPHECPTHAGGARGACTNGGPFSHSRSGRADDARLTGGLAAWRLMTGGLMLFLARQAAIFVVIVDAAAGFVAQPLPSARPAGAQGLQMTAACPAHAALSRRMVLRSAAAALVLGEQGRGRGRLRRAPVQGIASVSSAAVCEAILDVHGACCSAKQGALQGCMRLMRTTTRRMPLHRRNRQRQNPPRCRLQDGPRRGACRRPCTFAHSLAHKCRVACHRCRRASLEAPCSADRPRALGGCKGTHTHSRTCACCILLVLFFVFKPTGGPASGPEVRRRARERLRTRHGRP
jgi:hypothetical protein